MLLVALHLRGKFCAPRFPVMAGGARGMLSILLHDASETTASVFTALMPLFITHERITVEKVGT